MKIGLHLRTFFSKNPKINEDILNIIIQEFVQDKDNFFYIYIDENISIKEKFENINIKKIDYSNTSIKNQINFGKVLKEDNNDFSIFFDLSKPILHKCENDIFIINNLNNLLYETDEIDNFAKKFKYFFFLERSCLQAKQIVTFLDNLKNTLNEKVNIEEEKIKNIHPFFYKKDFSKYDGKLDILQKNKFIIYNSGSGKENLKLVFETIFNYNKNNSDKLDLIFIGDEYNDVEIRKMILEYDLVGSIKEIEQTDEKIYSYYKNASFVIYPTLYDVFPFELNDAMNIGTPILASDNDAIKEIFGDSLFYFKSNSIIDLENKMKELLEKNDRFDYSKVFEKYSAKNFVKNIKNIFPEIKKKEEIIEKENKTQEDIIKKNK